MTQYATRFRKSAPLHSDFAKSFVERRFGPVVAKALYEALPLFKRGPRKGLVKGYIHWRKVEKGGWVKDGPGYCVGHVVRPGTQDVEIRTGRYADEGRQIIYEDQREKNSADFADFARRAVSDAFAKERTP